MFKFSCIYVFVQLKKTVADAMGSLSKSSVSSYDDVSTTLQRPARDFTNTPRVNDNMYKTMNGHRTWSCTTQITRKCAPPRRTPLNAAQTRLGAFFRAHSRGWTRPALVQKFQMQATSVRTRKQNLQANSRSACQFWV